MQINKNAWYISHVNILLVKWHYLPTRHVKQRLRFDECRMQKLSTFDNRSSTGVFANKDGLPAINKLSV